MIELIRLVEQQANLSSYRATQNEERAAQLELLFAITQPKHLYSAWHPLIATSFKCSPPHPQARFRPPYGKNVFYSSFLEETALYEQAFHFIKQRMHLAMKTETGLRTLFVVDVDHKDAVEIKKDKQGLAIMDKHDYSASHHFIHSNPHITAIIYPSCRDPQQRNNAAILDINHLEKKPKWESVLKFFYDNQKKQILWIDYNLSISWQQIA